MPTIVPNFPYDVPTLGHTKDRPYLDFPLVYNETVTERAFYAQYDFTIATSTLANTTLYKWNGGTWTPIANLTNPDLIQGRGFFAVTTSAAEFVTITEHVN